MRSWLRHCDTMTEIAPRRTFVHPTFSETLLSLQSSDRRTLISQLRSFLRNSLSSGAVMRLLLRFCTMILANSTSCSISPSVTRRHGRWVTSSFSRQSAMVRYIRSGLRFRHNWRMIKLPRVSSSRRSVQKSLRRLTMKNVKYESSLFLEI